MHAGWFADFVCLTRMIVDILFAFFQLHSFSLSLFRPSLFYATVHYFSFLVLFCVLTFFLLFYLTFILLFIPYFHSFIQTVFYSFFSSNLYNDFFLETSLLLFFRDHSQTLDGCSCDQQKYGVKQMGIWGIGFQHSFQRFFSVLITSQRTSPSQC